MMVVSVYVDVTFLAGDDRLCQTGGILEQDPCMPYKLVKITARLRKVVQCPSSLKEVISAINGYELFEISSPVFLLPHCLTDVTWSIET